MKMLYRLMLLSLLFASHASAEALLNANIIRCEEHLGLQRDCTIPQDLELLPRQEIESDFYVSYTLGCDRKYRGPMPSKLQLRLESGANLTLNYKDSQGDILVGTGMGPLVLTDTFPKELANRSFNECQLSFSSIRAMPSARVRSIWQAQLEGNQRLLESKLALVSSLERVAVLLPAYQFFKNLSERLEGDLRQNEEVVRLARDLSSCKQGEDCDLLFRLSSDTTINLSLEERLLIIQLRGLLAEVSQTEATAALRIEDRLSQESLKILEKLSKDAAYYEDVEGQIRQVQAEIEKIRGEISTFEAQLK